MNAIAACTGKPGRTKTEQSALEAIAKKGFWVGRGKRAFNAAKRMQADDLVPGASFQFEAFNANAARSQWHHPKFIPAYEVVISTQCTGDNEKS